MTDQTERDDLLDDAQRDELLDGLLDGVPAPDPVAATRRAPYDALAADLRALAPPPAGWQARVEARVAAERAAARRRRRTWAAVGGGVALAAAAVVAVLVTRDPPSPDRRAAVAIATVAPDGAPRRGTAAVGDTLRVTATAGAGVELRIYRGGQVVLRCPGDPGCAVTEGSFEAGVRLDVPGLYRVVRLTGRGPIPPPASGPDASLDLDLLTLREAGVAIELEPAIEVSP